jgi:RNA recognition motif-containing protein
MQTVDEAVRAVETLHDQQFMGRRLVVNGSRSDGSREPRV